MAGLAHSQNASRKQSYVPPNGDTQHLAGSMRQYYKVTQRKRLLTTRARGKGKELGKFTFTLRLNSFQVELWTRDAYELRYLSFWKLSSRPRRLPRTSKIYKPRDRKAKSAKQGP